MQASLFETAVEPAIVKNADETNSDRADSKRADSNATNPNGLRFDRVDESVIEVLRQSQVKGNSVTLPRLDPDLYRKVDKVLKRLGGRWKSKASAHIFPSCPTGAIWEVIRTGMLAEENPEEFFPTPAPVVDQMIEAAAIELETVLRAAPPDEGWWMLEPSAGSGAIARRAAMHFKARLDCVEIHPARVLELKGQGFNVFKCDFLTEFSPPENHYFGNNEPPRRYRLVMMNPPFRHYAAHILKAWELISYDGVLVSVVPASFAYQKGREAERLRELVDRHGYSVALDPEAFKASGTSVPTMMIVLTRLDVARGEVCGYPSLDAFQLGCYANHWRENYLRRLDLFRQVAGGIYSIDEEGRPDERAEAMIRQYYLGVRDFARADGTILRVREADLASLGEEFIVQYLEWQRYERGLAA